jgi:hypothetical protein
MDSQSMVKAVAAFVFPHSSGSESSGCCYFLRGPCLAIDKGEQCRAIDRSGRRHLELPSKPAGSHTTSCRTMKGLVQSIADVSCYAGHTAARSLEGLVVGNKACVSCLAQLQTKCGWTRSNSTRRNGKTNTSENVCRSLSMSQRERHYICFYPQRSLASWQV